MKSYQIQQNSALTYCIPGYWCYLGYQALLLFGGKDWQAVIHKHTVFPVLGLVHLLNMYVPDVTTLIATSHKQSAVCRVNLSLLAVFTWSLRTKGVVCGLWVHCRWRATIACHHFEMKRNGTWWATKRPAWSFDICHIATLTSLLIFPLLCVWDCGWTVEIEKQDVDVKVQKLLVKRSWITFYEKPWNCFSYSDVLLRVWTFWILYRVTLIEVQGSQ